MACCFKKRNHIYGPAALALLSLALSGCATPLERQEQANAAAFATCSAAFPDAWATHTMAKWHKCATDKSEFAFDPSHRFHDIHVAEIKEKSDVFSRYDKGLISQPEAESQLSAITQKTKQEISRRLSVEQQMFNAQQASRPPQVIVIQPAPQQPSPYSPPPATTVPSCAEGYQCMGRHKDADGVWR